MLVNSKQILDNAKNNNCAIIQFNINNLEWTKYILEASNELKKEVILGVSEGAINYMGGVNVVTNLIANLIQDLNITTNTVLHLDHGKTFDICKKCIDSGFTSVMIDASAKSLEENINITKQVVEYAHKHNVTVEAEVGRISGIEETTINDNNNAKLQDVIRLVRETNIDSIAPAVGSVHGLYTGTPNIDFNLIKSIKESVNIPIVLHGGTGLSDAILQESIRSGINKININTELQIAWTQAVREYLKTNEEIYDPRKIISSGEHAIKKIIKDKTNI